MLCISENEVTYFRHLNATLQSVAKMQSNCIPVSSWSIMIRYWLEVKAAVVKLSCLFFFHGVIKCLLGMVDLSSKCLELGK